MSGRGRMNSMAATAALTSSPALQALSAAARHCRGIPADPYGQEPLRLHSHRDQIPPLSRVGSATVIACAAVVTWRSESCLVGAENLCHQAIFVDDATRAVMPLDPEMI